MSSASSTVPYSSMRTVAAERRYAWVAHASALATRDLRRRSAITSQAGPLLDGTAGLRAEERVVVLTDLLSRGLVPLRLVPHRVQPVQAGGGEHGRASVHLP